MSFSSAIKELRIFNMKSQQEFAKELGVSFATVNRWENGKASPNFKTMKKIDNYCKINSPEFDFRRKMMED